MSAGRTHRIERRGAEGVQRPEYHSEQRIWSACFWYLNNNENCVDNLGSGAQADDCPINTVGSANLPHYMHVLLLARWQDLGRGLNF